jgi:surface antigen
VRSSSRLVRSFSGLVVLTLALLLGVGTLAQADTLTATSLTIAAPSSVPAFTSATVKGKLLDASGHPVKAATVIIHWRKAGASDWARSTTATTSSKGAWSTKIILGLNTELGAAYAGGATTAASSSPVVITRATQSVKITKVSPARPAIGQLLTVSGTASKALWRRTVSLQRRTNGVWATLTTTKITKAGTFSVAVRVTDASALTLRVRSGSTTAISRATSSTRYVYVAVTATLYAGQKLGARRVLSSPDGRYTATQQTDGNLVVRTSGGTRLWASGTAGKGFALRLSDAGNLTIGTADKVAWQTTTKASVARLVMQNDGNLVLFAKAKTLWSSAKGAGVAVRPALCWSVSFDCVTFSGYVSSTSYWRMYAGHNCTNYVAYRMIMKGVQNPPWGYPGGSAWQWRAGAKKAKIKVDTTPAVGAVMQWGRNSSGGGSSGHVVYVERVTDTSVTISEDSWSGHAAVRVIQRDSSSFRDARFIHVKDDAS